MFLNPIWSLLLLAGVIAGYVFYVRPRLHALFTKTFDEFDSFWSQLWERIKAFRDSTIAAVGAVLAALPDLLVQIAPLDFSSILPQAWGVKVAAVVGLLIAVCRIIDLLRPKAE